MLEIDAEAAQADLKTRPFDFGFPLRPYQKEAIETVEDGLAEGRRNMLLAMATGTGKTKLAIAMLYRLLAAKRFRRVAFIVDRNALGTQAAGEFSTTRIVSAKTFADIFGLKGLDAVTPESETKVHICTIQGLVKRVLYTEDPADVPSVDQYDLVVVDECHRGYLLDRIRGSSESGRILATFSSRHDVRTIATNVGQALQKAVRGIEKARLSRKSRLELLCRDVAECGAADDSGPFHPDARYRRRARRLRTASRERLGGISRRARTGTASCG